MTEFLVKTFIKDYKNIEDERVRTKYGLMASVVGIICNVILFASKLLTGLLINSISVMADAFNNLSDAASSVIGFIGVKLAGKPADEEHPFGHGRIEYIAAFIVAFLVIQVGFSLFKTSIVKIKNPEELSFKMVSVVILLFSVCIKLWLGFFNRKLGRRVNSSVMMATAADSLGDVGTTSAAILSIAVYGIWGYNIDGIIGVAVSIVVIVAGINIAKDTLAPLIGEPVDPELYEEINNFVGSFDGIEGTHDLIVHNYGPSKSMASIHAEVPNDVSIEKSHEIIDHVEREAMRRFGIFLVIHMDPIEMKNIKILEFHNMVKDVLNEVDSKLKFHDLRVVEGEKQITLIFDLVIPREYKKQLHVIIKDKVCEQIAIRDSRCSCMITVESSFCAEE